MNLCCYWSVLLVGLCVCAAELIVYTENGAVQGKKYKTSSGRVVNAFLGIPYAKPPVGTHRFEEPQAVEKWPGVWPATKASPMCLQYYLHKSEPIMGEEDCLYLNIYTPTISNNSLLDVLVYIHGGAFMFGEGEIFTPNYILDNNDLIYLTINYRLGPFGFLSTEDKVVPGNNGMKDQVLALRWVQENIKYFGGDPSKVTIAGMSAGGASVHLHYMSSLSQSLFDKGISLSGTALCPWVLAENSREKAKMLAASVGCPTSTSEKMVECLKQRTARKLLDPLESLFMPWRYNPFSPFGVVVEKGGDNPFLNKHPYQLLLDGKVKDAPWLTSATTEEGLYPGADFASSKEYLLQLNENWNTIAPHLLDYNNTIPAEELNNISETIRRYYLGSESVSEKNVGKLIDMISDRLFIVHIERAARLQAAVTKSPVYFYSFGYRGKYTLSNLMRSSKQDFGVSHGDDLIYLLSRPKISPLETEEDKAMTTRMLNMWTSFMESGVPSPAPDVLWSPIAPGSATNGLISYLFIRSSNKMLPLYSADLGHAQFWDSLPFQENINQVIHKLSKSERKVDEL